MARLVSTKTLALRALEDTSVSNLTKLVALQAARTYLTPAEYGRRLRQLTAKARAKTLRLCLIELAEWEKEQLAMASKRAEAAEIDRVLEEAAQELGLEIGEEGGSKPIPESAEQKIAGPPATVPSVPDNGVSCATASHPHSEWVAVQELEQPTVRETDSITDEPAIRPLGAHTDDRPRSGREELLAQGRALATSVFIQYERFTRAPQNLQESKRLDDLQQGFSEWQSKALAVGIDVQAEFGYALPILRPFQRKMDLSRLRNQLRKTLSVPELCMVPRAQPQTHGPRDDGSLWASAGPAI